MIRERLIIVLLVVLSIQSNAQTIITIAGTGINGFNGDNGPATSAKIGSVHGVAFDKNGNFYFSEYNGHRVRKVSPTGVITTVVGTMGIIGYGGDGGPATAAKLKYPEGVACDTAGNLYIADKQNYRIRRVDIATGIITTFAGSGVTGVSSGDGGPASAASFFPSDIQFDKWGNLYVSDNLNANNNVRRINTSGIISTVAGTGICEYNGDGIPATTASFCGPAYLSMDDTGNVYVTDQLNKRIRKIALSGIITTVAGTGIGLYNGDEMPATTSNVGALGVVFFNNNLYITDSNARVRWVDALGIMHTIAGTGVLGYGGDGGPATTSQVYMPGPITVDLCGDVYFADVLNYRIRKISMPPVLTVPSISLSSTTSSAVPGTNVTINATVSNAGSSYVIHWMNKGVEFTTTTVPSVTYTKAAGIDTITARVVSTAAYGCYDSTTSGGWVVSTSGVSLDKLAMTRIGIWPNPVGNELHIDDVVALSSYRVVSMVGTVVLEGELHEGSNRIDVHMLPVGIYMVVVNDREGRKSVVRMMKR